MDISLPLRGTLHYMAPELLNPQDPKLPIDIWAWAIIAVELIVEQLPYEWLVEKKDIDIKWVLKEVGAGRIKFPLPKHPDLKGSFKQLVISCLDRNFDKRPNAVEVLLTLNKYVT